MIGEISKLNKEIVRLQERLENEDNPRNRYELIRQLRKKRAKRNRKEEEARNAFLSRM